MRHAVTRLVIVVALSIPALLLSACSGTSEYAIVGTARAAGTDGTVQVEPIEGGNHLITLSLKHLPPPARLGNGLTTYVVWLVPHQGQPNLAAVLGFDPDSRTGNATATTPFEQFTIKVTAERNRNVATPSDIVVATRSVNVH